MAKSTLKKSTPRKSCFVIMPISDVPDYPTGHFGEVYRDLIEPAVVDAGYDCHLATSTSSAHMIQLDVITKIATADLCICDLSTNNPNVMFEYGIRQAFDKPTVLIKDIRTSRIFDLSGFRDIEYDPSLRHSTVIEIREKITEAIKHTVEGSEDKGQIFSLVKLMKLTAAAIPTGEVSQADAQMQIMQIMMQKVDSLHQRLEQKERMEAARARALDTFGRLGVPDKITGGAITANAIAEVIKTFPTKNPVLTATNPSNKSHSD